MLDPAAQSATLAFSNVGDTPTEADVVVQLGYTTWQNTDTVLFSPTWAREGPRDTVLIVTLAHFEGYESDCFVTSRGERINMCVRMGAAFTIHSDGILRRFIETDMLPPGHYTFVFRLVGYMDEFPAACQLPMDTASVSMPVDVK